MVRKTKVEMWTTKVKATEMNLRMTTIQTAKKIPMKKTMEKIPMTTGPITKVIPMKMTLMAIPQQATSRVKNRD